MEAGLYETKQETNCVYNKSVEHFSDVNVSVLLSLFVLIPLVRQGTGIEQ